MHGARWKRNTSSSGGGSGSHHAPASSSSLLSSSRVFFNATEDPSDLTLIRPSTICRRAMAVAAATEERNNNSWTVRRFSRERWHEGSSGCGGAAAVAAANCVTAEDNPTVGGTSTTPARSNACTPGPSRKRTRAEYEEADRSGASAAGRWLLNAISKLPVVGSFVAGGTRRSSPAVGETAGNDPPAPLPVTVEAVDDGGFSSDLPPPNRCAVLPTDAATAAPQAKRVRLSVLPLPVENPGDPVAQRGSATAPRWARSSCASACRWDPFEALQINMGSSSVAAHISQRRTDLRRRKRGLGAADYRSILRRAKLQPCKWIDYYDYVRAAAEDEADVRAFTNKNDSTAAAPPPPHPIACRTSLSGDKFRLATPPPPADMSSSSSAVPLATKKLAGSVPADPVVVPATSAAPTFSAASVRKGFEFGGRCKKNDDNNNNAPETCAAAATQPQRKPQLSHPKSSEQNGATVDPPIVATHAGVEAGREKAQKGFAAPAAATAPQAATASDSSEASAAGDSASSEGGADSPALGDAATVNGQSTAAEVNADATVKGSPQAEPAAEELPWWKRNLNKPCQVTFDDDNFAENAEADESESKTATSAVAAAPPRSTVSDSTSGGLFGGTLSDKNKEGVEKTPVPQKPREATQPFVFSAQSVPDSLSTSEPAAALKSTPQVVKDSKTSGSLFGTAGTNDLPSSSLFGAPADSKPPSSLFAAVPTKDKPSDSLFGVATKGDKPGGSLFASDATNSAAPLFGATAANDKAVGSLFNTANKAEATGSLFGTAKKAEATGSLFGTANKTEATGSLFGNAAASGKPGESLFGLATAGDKSAGSLFGTSAASDKPAVSLFGGAASGGEAKTAGSLFAPASDKPTGSLFGSEKPTGSLFGSEKPTGSLFGSEKPTGSLLGSGAPSDKPVGSLFGAAAPGDKPISSLFGNASTTAGSLFGASTSTNQPGGSLFENQGVAATGKEAPASLFGGSVSSFNEQSKTGSQPLQQQQQKQQPPSLFDGASQGSLFGSQPEQQTGSTAGGNTSAAAPFGNLFGQPPANSSTINGGVFHFGGSPTAAQPTTVTQPAFSGGVFNNNKREQPQQQSLFGGTSGGNNMGSLFDSKPPSSSLFGGHQPTQSSLFDSTTAAGAPQANSLFGGFGTTAAAANGMETSPPKGNESQSLFGNFGSMHGAPPSGGFQGGLPGSQNSVASSDAGSNPFATTTSASLGIIQTAAPTTARPYLKLKRNKR